MKSNVRSDESEKGLVDPNDQQRKIASESPIEEHLQAFKASISKNTGKHVKLTMTRVRRLVREAEMKTLVDIDIESIEAVLGDMLEAEEIGHRTYNHYVQAMHQFCAWARAEKAGCESDCWNDAAKPRRKCSPSKASAEFRRIQAARRFRPDQRRRHSVL